VEIRWSRQSGGAGDELDFRWTESDGPEIGQPTRRGFGLKLIEREASYNLGGRAELDLHPRGLEARIRFPMEKA
jgi:two-component sensor histidine kinase